MNRKTYRVWPDRGSAEFRTEHIVDAEDVARLCKVLKDNGFQPAISVTHQSNCHAALVFSSDCFHLYGYTCDEYTLPVKAAFDKMNVPYYGLDRHMEALRKHLATPIPGSASIEVKG